MTTGHSFAAPCCRQGHSLAASLRTKGESRDGRDAADGALGAAGEAETSEVEASAGAGATEDVGLLAARGHADLVGAAEDDVLDLNTAGGSAGRRAVLVVLLDVDTVSGGARGSVALVGDVGNRGVSGAVDGLDAESVGVVDNGVALDDDGLDNDVALDRTLKESQQMWLTRYSQ